LRRIQLGHPPGSPTTGSDLELLAADTQLLESLPAAFLVVPALPEAFAHLSPNPGFQSANEAFQSRMRASGVKSHIRTKTPAMMITGSKTIMAERKL